MNKHNSRIRRRTPKYKKINQTGGVPRGPIKIEPKLQYNEEVFSFQAKRNCLIIATHPKNNIIATTNYIDYKNVYLWQMGDDNTNATCVEVIPANEYRITRIIFHPNYPLMIIAWDKKAELWHVIFDENDKYIKIRLIHTFQHHRSIYNFGDSIRFHPEHLLIAGNGNHMEFRLRMIKQDYSGVVDVFSYKFNEYCVVNGIAFHPTKPFMVVNIDNKKLITFNLNQTYNTFNIVNLYKLGRIWKAIPNGEELDIDITRLVNFNIPRQYYENNINEVLFHPTLNLLVYCSVFYMFIMRMNENTGKIMIIKIINYISSLPVDPLYIDGRNLTHYDYFCNSVSFHHTKPFVTIGIATTIYNDDRGYFAIWSFWDALQKYDDVDSEEDRVISRNQVAPFTPPPPPIKIIEEKPIFTGFNPDIKIKSVAFKDDFIFTPSKEVFDCWNCENLIIDNTPMKTPKLLSIRGNLPESLITKLSTGSGVIEPDSDMFEHYMRNYLQRKSGIESNSSLEKSLVAKTVIPNIPDGPSNSAGNFSRIQRQNIMDKVDGGNRRSSKRSSKRSTE